MGSQLATVACIHAGASTELTGRGDEHAMALPGQVLEAVRERVEAYGGRELRCPGDAPMFVFDSPRSAVTFVLAIQQQRARRPPGVRIGMDFGELLESRDGPTGPVATAAARIADRASAGEVLVSDIVRRLAGTMPGVQFLDRGRATLRGLPGRWQLHTVTVGPQTPVAPPVFGRESELATIDRFIASVTAGSGQILLLAGEAGIGKTHLARVTAARAAAAGATVVRGGADELEPDRPARILRAVTDTLGAPLEERGASNAEPGADPAYLVVEQFVDALENATSSGPVLLVVEDLHWADDLSLRGVAAVARRVAPLPLGLVASMRPTPRPPRLHRVLAICETAGARTLELTGLAPTDVAGLVASLTGGTPGPALRRRLDATAGNPLFVTELLRALDDDGALRVDTGVAETDETPLPAELVRTLSRRVATLPEVTAEVLRLASLLGSQFALADLARVAGRSVVEVAALLRDAVDATLIVGDGERLSFSHDLVREAVYEDIAPAIRTDLHLAAARSLAVGDASAQQVARHYALGAPPGDLVAVNAMVRAANEAAGTDLGAAAGFLERAVTLAPDDWPDRNEVESTLVQLLADSGRVDEARARAETLLDRSLTPEDELAARRAHASVLGRAGQLTEAVDHLRTAAALPGVGKDEAGILRCVAAGMSVIAGTGEPAEARATAQEYLDTPDPVLACWAHNTAAVATVASGEYDDLLEHARRARSLLDVAYVPALGFLLPHAWAATALFELDDLDGTAAATLLARQRAEERGETGLLTHAMTLATGLAWVEGRWDDAQSEADAALTLAEETGDHAQKLFHHAMAALLAIGRGNQELADEHVALGEEFFASGPQHPYGLELLLLARARLLEADGRPEDARAVLAMVWEQTANLRGLIQWRSIGPDLVRLTRVGGGVPRARTVATTIEDLAARSSSRSGAASAKRARGLAEADPDLLVAAVEMFRSGPSLVETAHTAEEAGVLLQDTDRGDEAAGMFEVATALHEQMGAQGHLARVEERLRAAGRRPRRTSRTATHGWDALSPRELEVVDRVAEGLSNPQIAERLHISRRTVETHLAHVFRKLDLQNRTQLATARLERSPSAALTGQRVGHA